MSKSLGNTIAPQEVCDKYRRRHPAHLGGLVGLSPTIPRFGPDIITANVETYRKLRNTMRYLLGALEGFSDAERVTRDQMPGLERWVLHRLAELDALVRQAYTTYDFKAAFHALLNFCTVDLSAVYFDIRKDSLYCDAPSSLRRRACRTVMDEIFKRLAIWYRAGDGLHLRRSMGVPLSGRCDRAPGNFPESGTDWLDKALAAKWAQIFEVRGAVTGALEVERREKRIGSSLEASVDVSIPDADMLAAFDGEDAAEIFITSGAQLKSGPAGEGQVAAVVSTRAPGVKCARSWKYFDPATADPDFPDITPRDAGAVREYRGLPLRSQKGSA